MLPVATCAIQYLPLKPYICAYSVLWLATSFLLLTEQSLRFKRLT